MGGYALVHQPIPPAIRRSLNRCAGCGLVLAILLMASASWAATYRWVDEKGRVHYGDSLPPQYSQRDHVELSSQGRVIKRETVKPKPTNSDLKERERNRRDNALLATYSNTAEIDVAKSRAVAQEQELLDRLLKARIGSKSKSEAAYLDGMIDQRRQALDAIGAKYDAEMARYLELTGGR